MPSELISGKTSFPGLHMAAFLVCSHTASSLRIQRERSLESLPLLTETPLFHTKAPPLPPHLTLITPSKVPISSTVTLGIRASTYDFGGMQTFDLDQYILPRKESSGEAKVTLSSPP